MNPLDVFKPHSYKTYDWDLDNEYNNIGSWIEEVAIKLINYFLMRSFFLKNTA